MKNKLLILTVLIPLLLSQCTNRGQSGKTLPDNQAAKIDSIIDMSKKLMRENPDSAKISLEQLLSLPEKNIRKIEEAKIYLQIGLIYSMKKELEKSDSLYQKATQLLNNVDDPCLLSSVYVNFGINQSKKGDESSAIGFYKRAEKIIESRTDKCADVAGRIYNNLGLSYRNIDKLDSAKYYYEKSLDYAKQSNDKQMIANYNRQNEKDKNLKRKGQFFSIKQSFLLL